MLCDPLSTLLVGRLTQLLDLNCLEELKALEECGYGKQNIELENSRNLDNFAAFIQSQRKNAYRKNRKDHHDCGLVISKEKLEMIVKLIDYLKADVGAEGLFRISGNRKRQLLLKQILQRGEDISSEAENWNFNTHDVAGILKELFGDLEEPLLTKQLYDCYQQLAEMNNEEAKDKKVETLRTLFMLLPPLNRFLLKKLIELLSHTVNNDNNKMDAYNLGVVFTPNIICTREISGSIKFTENMEPLIDLVKFVIENADRVFQIPENLIEEAKEIECKDETDSVPLRKTYCQRIAVNEYHREGRKNTNDAITMIYAQYLKMPDGPLKRELLAKFHECYPGTPMFIPNSMKMQMELSNSSTRNSFSKSAGFLHNSNKVATEEPTSIKNHMNNGESSGTTGNGGNSFGSVNRDQCNISSALKRPGSPSAKVKDCFKRMRRGSLELLQPESIKKLLPDHTKLNMDNGKKKFQRCTNYALRSFRKSLSSSSLNSKLKSRSASVDKIDDRKPRQQPPGESKRLHKSLDELSHDDVHPSIPSDSYDGISNLGFSCVQATTPTTPIIRTPTTPIIRKSLYPCMKNTSVPVESTPEQKSVRTPIIFKRNLLSKSNRSVKRDLLLENMQKIRERKILALSNESVGDGLSREKEYNNGISPIVDRMNNLLSRKTIVCSMHDNGVKQVSPKVSPHSVERDSLRIQKGTMRKNVLKPNLCKENCIVSINRTSDANVSAKLHKI